MTLAPRCAGSPSACSLSSGYEKGAGHPTPLRNSMTIPLLGATAAERAALGHGQLRVDHIRRRIDGLARHADFVVQVGTGRAAGRADEADQLALSDLLAGGDGIAGEMGIAGLHLAAMFDLDVVAVAAERFGPADHAVRGGIDRGTHRLCEIDAFVVAAAAEHRMG